MAASLEWPVNRVRETFFSYFVQNQHVQLPSSPVIPIDDPTLPLIYSGLNQFKRSLHSQHRSKGRGRRSSGVTRTCYSLRCILAAGDEDVMDGFGRDTSYHTMTEVLGSCSFGDYFKEDAIKLSWELLTQEYKLPQQNIYVTYFGGDTTSGPDTESLNEWKKYLPVANILPSMRKADFWRPDNIGPCGRCVGIYFDRSHNEKGSMNIHDDRFVEIWRIVFVEFDRKEEGALNPLQGKHVITGMNSESLTCILQKKSYYELNVFPPIMAVIHYCAGDGIGAYSGKVGLNDTNGVDTAYRLLADHLRAISAAAAYQFQLGLGTEVREYFLKCADKRAVRFAHKVLNTKQKFYHLLVNIALRSVGLFPSPEENSERISDIIYDEVKIYKRTLAEVSDLEQQPPLDELTEKEKKQQDDKNILPNVAEHSSSVVWYKTRVVGFLGRRTPIILKDTHRRSSLVALCNALLLGGKITLELDVTKVSEGHLLHLVQRRLLYGNMQMQLQRHLELSDFQKQVLGVLPQLPGSLFFDVKFASVDGFVRTPESALFQYLGVPLYHGWLVDPQDEKLASTIADSSFVEHSLNVAEYNSLQESTKSGVQKRDGREHGNLHRVEMISGFLRSPQLTPYGFSCLLNHLKEKEPCILIWNEYFITITKVEDKIYFLVNPLYLLNIKTSVVWEGLIEVNEGGLFVDCNFAPTDSNQIQSSLPLTKKERKKGKRKAKKRILLKDAGQSDIRASGLVSPPSTSDTGLVSPPSTSDTFYSMRRIDFFGRSTHIIHQDQNGPCPLIAICNVLLLKGEINFESKINHVSMQKLICLVQDFLKKSMKMQVRDSVVQRHILDIVPTLAEGLDVDIVFNRTNGFTITPEFMLFDCLDVPLRHGWIMDAALQNLLVDEISSQSFEKLTLAVKEPNFPNAEMIKDFLEGPQLTAHGLFCLHKDLIEMVPCVFYWNNHFSTIIKIKGMLYSLVTDVGYLETTVVWQLLNKVSGGGSYMNSAFMPNDLEQGPLQDNSPAPYPSVPETQTLPSVISLQDFIALPGHEFSIKRKLFAAGTSLEVADTTKVGRVLALDILKNIIDAHRMKNCWGGAFSLSTIYVIGGARAEIWLPFCPKFSEEAMALDYMKYITEITELFRVQGLGLPAFFVHFREMLERCAPVNQLPGFWCCLLNTLALKSSMIRAGLFSGIHRIRRFASSDVRSTLRSTLMSRILASDWRSVILVHGHPVLVKVLQYTPPSVREKMKEMNDEEREQQLHGYGLFFRDNNSLSIFPRQVNEHGKDLGNDGEKRADGEKKADEKKMEQGTVEDKEPFETLSELDLLYSHVLELYLPAIVEGLLCSPGIMTEELWQWLVEVLDDYNRPEVIDRPWDY